MVRKIIIPFIDTSMYHDNEDYLRMWFNATRRHLNDRLYVDGVVLVKDVLKSFQFRINGMDLYLLTEAWVSPLRIGMKHTRDKRYKVKIRLKKNNRKVFPYQYALVMYLPERKRK